METGISEIQLEKMRKIFAKYSEIENVILFGSRAKGNFRKNSDIDFALNGNISLTVRNRIFNDLEELDFPYEIDLVVFNKITNQELIENIQQNGIEIYNKKYEIIKT